MTKSIHNEIGSAFALCIRAEKLADLLERKFDVQDGKPHPIFELQNVVSELKTKLKSIWNDDKQVITLLEEIEKRA
jgi:hypothetical protein